MEGYLPHEIELSFYGKISPSMAYSPAECTLGVWQETVREKLQFLLGLPYEKCDSRFRIESETDYPDYTDTRFIFQSEENYYVPCHFLYPKKHADAKPPVMICLQGHSTGMHISLGVPIHEEDEETISEGDRDFARQCVKRGLCALTVEQRCFGERGGTPSPDCYKTAMAALLTGRTLLGARVWDIERAVDVITEHFSIEADVRKIYCMGNSGGGTATFYAAALDTRIVAAMPSCSFCSFEKSIASLRHCACNFVPGIRKYFDMADIAGLIAPRPIVIVSGREDGIFPIEGADSEFSRLKDIYYANSVSPGNCVHVTGAQGHRFYAEDSWAEFMKLI